MFCITVNRSNDSATVVKQSGFSLLEVLITMAIISVGLLGLAAMQATGLQNNQSAYQRSQASVLSYDIADRMRSNMGSINSYLSNSKAPKDAVRKAGCISTGACTSGEMAENDLYEWYSAVTTQLPGATAAITFTAPSTYTVTVNWDDNRDGATDSADAAFALSFQP